MILKLFLPGELSDALRWSAGGGLSFVPDPLNNARRSIPWYRKTKVKVSGYLYGCDGEALHLLLRAIWVNWITIRGRRTPHQWHPIVGMPLRRILWRCGQFSSSEYQAGLLWMSATRKTPARVLRSEVRAEWMGSTPRWEEYRPGFAFYSLLPAGKMEWEWAVIGQSLLEEMSRQSQRFERIIPVRMHGGPFLTGLGCRTQEEVITLLGAALLSGNITPTDLIGGGWTIRKVIPPRESQEYDANIQRWCGRSPTSNELQHAGF